MTPWEAVDGGGGGGGVGLQPGSPKMQVSRPLGLRAAQQSTSESRGQGSLPDEGVSLWQPGLSPAL